MKPTAAGIPAAAVAHRVGESRLLVDDDVVRAGDALVVRVGVEERGHLVRRDIAQAGEVKDLHAVVARAIGDDEGVVLVRLDVAP